jgi:hypothetical protein
MIEFYCKGITDYKMKISQWTRSDGQMKLTTMADKNVMCAIEYVSMREAEEKL